MINLSKSAKKNIFSVLVFAGLLSFILLIGFVIALASTTVKLTQNTTKDYDKEGAFNITWVVPSTASNANVSLSVSLNNGPFKLNATNASSGSLNSTDFFYFYKNLTDGNYTFTVSVIPNNGSAASNSTNISIVFDDTVPVLSYGVGTPANNTNLSMGNIYVNVTASDANNDSLLFNLYYTNGTLVNSSIFSHNNYSVTSLNWTGLTNNTYHYNITANDSATNINISSTRVVTLDTDLPSVTLAKSSTSATGTLVLDISVSDSTSGIAGIVCSASGGGSDTIVVASSGASQTATQAGLACGGSSYTYTVTCDDHAGNTGSASGSFLTSACSGSSGSGGSGSGGSGATWSNTYSEDDEELGTKGPVSKQLADNDRVKVKINNEAHHVGITGLTTTIATIEVASNPQTAALSIGDSRRFEITGDNYYDLLVTLNGISNNKANLTIASINEEVTLETEGTEQELEEDATRVAEEGSEEKKRKLWLWIVIIVVLVGIAVGVAKAKKKE